MKDVNGKEEIIKVMISSDRKRGAPAPWTGNFKKPAEAQTVAETDIQLFFWREAMANELIDMYAIKQIAVENGKDDMLLDTYNPDQYQIQSGEVYNAKLETDDTLTLITF